jgi:protein-disulfide isomerase
MSPPWKFAIGVLVGFVLCQTGQAQENGDGDLRKAVVALKDDVNALKEKHEQVLNELKELRKIVGVNVETPPALKLPPTISVTGESFRGDMTAVLAIIEYADFECEYCKLFAHETYPKIADTYIKTGKVKYFYRDLTTHPHAIPAARAAHCAGEQGKFWEMHDSLFANQDALAEKDISNRAPSIGLDSHNLSECLSSARYTDEIQRSTADAKKMGIVGTPTFLFGIIEQNSGVFTVKHSFVGAYPYEFFRSEIDDLLAALEKHSK